MGRKVHAPKRKSSLPNIEGQCWEPPRKTVCGVPVTSGSCVFLSVLVFSFGALLCAFLMNVTDRWELQVTAYGIATAATFASLFFISFVRTSPDDGDATSPPFNRAASSGQSRTTRASFKSRQHEFVRPSNLWMPEWTGVGPFLNTSNNEDWFVLPENKEQSSRRVPLPIPTPVHTPPPASTAFMVFQDPMLWSSPPPSPSGLHHV